ncbi:MAG: hypothetical protein JO258_11110 [Alphaproteobacteria bacterium]|nr:hypothetical protein [Alphaproteobacteria bacterium]
MVGYLFMAALGLSLVIASRCVDRTVRGGPLGEIEAVTTAVFVARSAGLMISLAGIMASAWSAWS